MTLRATLLAAIGLIALPAQAQNVDGVNANTTTVTSLVLNNGNIGGDCTTDPTGFAFLGDEGLCGAGFLVGLGPANVIGDGYILDTTTGWTPTGPIADATDFPYSGFDSGSVLVYNNAAESIDIVHTVYYGETNPDVVIHQFEITNTAADTRDGIYPGLFADWDVGQPVGGGTTYDSNEVTRTGSTLYVVDPTGASSNVFGTSLLSHPLTGWDYNIAYPPAAGQPQNEDEMYEGMTTTPVEGDFYDGADPRWVEATGPVSIGAGETFTFVTAFAAGTSVDDFLANVASAQAVVTADESGPRRVTDALSVPAPNPTTGTARVVLSLDAAETVRVSLSDVLGRTVAVLHEGALAAGDTPLAIDAADLAPGVYVIRAEGETFRQTRTLSVAR